METLPIWAQLLALFGLPALGTYVGMRTGLVRMETRMEAFKETLGEHGDEIKSLRRKTHTHANVIGKLALKANLTGGFPIEEDS